MKQETKEGRRLLFACAHFRKRMRQLEPLKITQDVVEAARLYGIEIKEQTNKENKGYENRVDC